MAHLAQNGLPDIDNQYPDFGASGTLDKATFLSLMKVEGIIPTAMVELKRRYVVAGVNTYDADWQDITEYLTLDGIGDLSAGVDDTEYLSGVVRSDYISLTFDNSSRKFNRRDSAQSLWYDAATEYYIDESKIKISFGFKLDGNTYYREDPNFTGKIIGDNMRYNVNSNGAVVGVRSFIEDLKEVLVSEYLPNSVVAVTDYLSISNTLIKASGLDCKYNAPRYNPYLVDTNAQTSNLYDIMEQVANDTDSLFGMSRNGSIFMTYFDSPYVTDTSSSILIPTAGAINYYNFDENTTTSNIIDAMGATDISIAYSGTTTVPNTLCSGLSSDNSRKFYSDKDNIFDIALTTSQKNFEMVFKINNISAFPAYYYKELGSIGLVLSLPASVYNSQATVEITSSTILRQNFGADTALFSMYNKTTAGDNHFINLTRDGFGYYDLNGIIGADPPFGFGATSDILTSSVYDTEFPLYLRTGLTYYFASEFDSAENKRRFILNGKYVSDWTYVSDEYPGSVLNNALATAGLKLFSTFNNIDIEFDTLKISSPTIGAIADYKDIAYRLSNNIEYEPYGTHNFYNYGSNNNILAITSYDDGISKVRNRVTYSNITLTAYSLYKSSFAFTYPSDTTMYSYVGFYNDNTMLDNTIHGFRNDTELATLFDTQPFLTYTIDATGTTSYIDVSAQLNTEELSGYALGFFSLRHTTAATLTLFSLTSLEKYKGYFGTQDAAITIPAQVMQETVQHVNFELSTNTLVYNYLVREDTSSAYEYGKKTYSLNTTPYLQDDIDYIYDIADAFLEEKAQPKERISIKTEFLEGDLELFDKVTINWRPDSDNPAVYEGTDYDSDDVGSSIGNIDWDSKDFWVIAYRHSWRDQSTQYTLREV